MSTHESGSRPVLESGFLANLKHDAPAALVVFLVALPLCLGIALASNAPLMAGITAGIVGGIFIGYFSGSPLSVSGPAAGLAVIVAASIQQLGGYEVFLVAVVLSGAIQVLLGFLRAGALASFVPGSVIKGMLAAIGIVIFLKQIPHALGRDHDFEGDFEFIQHADGLNTFEEIAIALISFSPGAVIIAVLSLVLLLLWERPLIKRNAWLKMIPGPLLVVFLGIGLNALFHAAMPAWELLAADKHLVQLPRMNEAGGALGLLHFPDWQALTNTRIYSIAFTIAIVGSLETLLCLEATDKIDPFRRISDVSKELKAQGMGNMISGLLGGLPITSVIVRTSANVYAGGRTRWSSVGHGLLLLVCLLLIPGLLNQIPLASLAAILLLVGYRLARVQLFVSVFKSGWAQFLPFLVTILAIVFTDLLIGIGIGLATAFIFVILTAHQNAFTLVKDDSSMYYLLRFNKDVTFLNKAELKAYLQQIPDGASLRIDGGKARIIDGDIQETVLDFMHAAQFRNITIEPYHLELDTRFAGGSH